jgi:hypothetical protein
MPLANALIEPGAATVTDPTFPLHVMVCEACWLVQLERTIAPDILFSNYSYFSSISSGWVAQAERFAAGAIARFGLSNVSRVVEIASNDGYLLQHLVERQIPCLGIEPAENVAVIARAKGVPTETQFFGREVAQVLRDRDGPADLIVANNVLGHVPDLHDFTKGLAILLDHDGSVSVEVPHVANMIEQHQFDTIYHEHVYYFSLIALRNLFALHGLAVVDIEELPTHGGSLRLYLRHAKSGIAPSDAVYAVHRRELAMQLNSPAGYSGFSDAAIQIQSALRRFVAMTRHSGKSIAAYGAAAKGNVLLNACGLGPAELDYVADLSPHKQGRLMPGCRLPIVAPERIAETRPDYILILPWNLTAEITRSLDYIGDWGGSFVTAIPDLRVWPAKERAIVRAGHAL